MKKTISKFIALVVLLAIFLPNVTIYAENQAQDCGATSAISETGRYKDHIPTEINDNLIGSVGGGIYDLQYLSVDNDGDGSAVQLTRMYSESYFTVTSGAEYDGNSKVGKNSYRQLGAQISQSLLRETPSNGTNYVVRFSVRKNSSSPGDTGVSFVAHDPDNYSVNHTTKNHGQSGLLLTDNEWVTFADTLCVPDKHEHFAQRTNNPILETVFTEDALAGTSFDVSWKAAGTEEFYLAKEKAHDITNTLVSGSADMIYGDTVKLKAQVLNQIGDTGYLKQNFIWKAVDNETREQETDGIIITPSKDTTTAKVFVDSNVPQGEYAIVAYSTDYAIARGFVVTVKEAKVFSDYIPSSKPDNLIPTYNATNFTGRWLATFEAIAPNHPGGIEGIMRYPIEKERTVGNVTYPQYWGDLSPYAVAGGDLTDNENNNTGIGNGIYSWKADTNYVISTDLMNSPNAEVKHSKFVYQMISEDSEGNICMPCKILDITSDSEWQTFSFVLHTDFAGDKLTKLHYGYPNHSSIRNPQGTEIRHRLGSFYIAEERAYGIDVSSPGKVLNAGKGKLEFSALVLNQAEIPYEGKTDIKWYVMNEYRSKMAEGFTIEVSSDGKNATVSADKSVPFGKYIVIAEDSTLGIEDFRKGTEITVAPCDVDFYDGGAHICVSTWGDDANYGTKASPLETLEGALQKIENLKEREIPVSEVVFRGGDYTVSNVAITDVHSGTGYKNIVFRSFEGEKAVFKGSVELDGTKAQYVHNGDVLNRLQPQVRDKVVVIDLESIPKTELFNPEDMHTAYEASGRDYNVLYIDGEECMLSQWPNGNQYTRRGSKAGDYSFYYNEDRISKWKTAPDFWIACFPAWNFTYMRTYVTGIDTDSKTITVTDKSPYVFADNVHDDGTEPLREWKAYNLMEEIDLPGEYYIDRENSKLYFYPTKPPSESKIELSVNAKPLLNLNGVANITFSDLEFAKTCSYGVYAMDINNVDFENCIFRDIGTYAYFAEGSEKPKTGAGYWQESYLSNNASYNCDIRNCSFDNIGGSAIYQEGGNVDTLTHSGNIIENNFVSGASVNFINNGAVLIGGVGTTVRNNIISKSMQHAITLYGNEHLITRNEIYGVLRNVADAGAIYQGRNFIARGSTISQNYIHDITSFEGTSGMDGIYMDDSQQGNVIEQNIIVNVPTGYNSNGAGDMKFRNNTILNSDKSWNFHWTGFELHAIVGGRDYMRPDVSMVGTLSDLENIIADKDLYFSRYPNLRTLCETKINPKTFTVISGNLSVNEDKLPENIIRQPDIELSTWENNTIEIADFDEIFADPQNHDYRLKSDSKYAIASPGLISENNFDMSLIGTQHSFQIPDTLNLLYPYKESVCAGGFELFWQDNFGLDTYIVEVSEDSTFETIVFTESVSDCVCTVPKGILENEKTYYWRVTAQNGSKDLSASYTSDAAAFYVSDILISHTPVVSVGTTSEFNFSVLNSGEEDITADIYVCAYDSDNNLCAMIPYFDVSLGNFRDFVKIDTEGKYEADEIRIMVWKKGRIVPMTKSSSFSPYN